MCGLTHNRGLFVPDTLPVVAPVELESWRSLGYAKLATAIIMKFVGECKVLWGVLADIVQQSCAVFWSPEVTPLVKVDKHDVLVSHMHICICIYIYIDCVRSRLTAIPTTTRHDAAGAVQLARLHLQGRGPPYPWQLP